MSDFETKHRKIILCKTAIDEQIAALRAEKRELAAIERELVQADLAERKKKQDPGLVQRAGM